MPWVSDPKHNRMPNPYSQHTVDEKGSIAGHLQIVKWIHAIVQNADAYTGEEWSAVISSHKYMVIKILFWVLYKVAEK